MTESMCLQKDIFCDPAVQITGYIEDMVEGAPSQPGAFDRVGLLQGYAAELPSGACDTCPLARAALQSCVEAEAA